MKKILSLFVFPIMCIASEMDLFSNIHKAWNMFQQEMKVESIDYITDLIENFEVSQREKFHYLYVRSAFYTETFQYDKAWEDREKFKEIWYQNPDLSEEFFEIYHYKFPY